MSKKIIIKLSEQEISRAIKELEDYKNWVEQKTELLCEKIADRLAGKVKAGFSGAVVDDVINGDKKLAQVSVFIDKKGTSTIVVAEGEDAIWVEFGAGVYHNNSPGSSPHPKGAELGFIIGDFDKGNGKRQTWAYYEEGKLKITHGTKAIMPMYTALKEICEEIYSIAKEVFV